MALDVLSSQHSDVVPFDKWIHSESISESSSIVGPCEIALEGGLFRATYALPNRGPPSALRNSPFVSPTETRLTSREGLPKKPTNDPPLLPRNTDAPARLPLMAYGEWYMSMDIGTYKCTGYADYAIGYERRPGGLLAVVETRKRATYNSE